MAPLATQHSLEDDYRQKQQHDSLEQPRHQQNYNTTQRNHNQLQNQQEVAQERAHQHDVKQKGIDQQGIEQQGFESEHAQQQHKKSHNHTHLPEGRILKYLCTITKLQLL